MQSLKPERVEAKRLYVIEKYSIGKIHKMLNGEVSRKTLYNWKNNVDELDDDTWDNLRKADYKESEDIRKMLKEALRGLIREAITSNDPMLHFAIPKYLQSIKGFGDVEKFFDEMKDDVNKDKKIDPKKFFDKMEEFFGTKK